MAVYPETILAPAVPYVRLATLDEVIKFTTDTHNYHEFDLTRPDFNNIYGCLDARSVVPPKGKKNKIIIQTAGGGAGEVDDRMVAEAALTGEMPTPDVALHLEKELRGTTVLGGHEDCKFEIAQSIIKQEGADPSDATLESVERTLYEYNRHKIVMPLMPRIIEAAGAQLKDLEIFGIPADFHTRLDNVYPDKSNVCKMFGHNQAQVYVVNHSPKIGLDRNKKADILLNEGVDIQVYHESRGAVHADLTSTYSAAKNLPDSLGPEPSQKEIQRALDYRIGAFALRSCAAETVLTSLRPTKRFEITHTTRGLEIEEMAA